MSITLLICFRAAMLTLVVWVTFGAYYACHHPDKKKWGGFYVAAAAVATTSWVAFAYLNLKPELLPRQQWALEF